MFGEKQTGSTLYFVSVYLFAVGILYLWGFWSTFRINALEFLSLSDVVKVAAYPVAASCLGLGLGVIFAAVMDLGDLPPGGGRRTPIGEFLTKHFWMLKVGYLVLVLAVLFFSPSVWKWVVLPFLFAFPIHIILMTSGWLENLIPVTSFRRAVIMIIVILPAAAFGFGRLRADDFLRQDDTDSSLSLSRFEVVGSGSTPVPSEARYLGKLGDYAFFLLPDESITIALFEDAQPLTLAPFQKRKAEIDDESDLPKPRPPEIESRDVDSIQPSAAATPGTESGSS